MMHQFYIKITKNHDTLMLHQFFIDVFNVFILIEVKMIQKAQV